MALWKQPRQQPFTTYRDPKNGQWITLKPTQLIQDISVESPVYRDLETGKWTTVKPSIPPPSIG